MPGRVDAITAGIAALDARIEQQIAPFAAAVHQLDEVTGISLAAAHAIIAEIGLDMARFPTTGHLVSWAKYAPGVKESAGKKKGKNSTGHGNTYLARILGNAAAAAAKTGTFPGERYRRIARRRGATKANVAIGRSILVIIWHLLSDPDAHYTDLGPDFYASRTDPARRRNNHVRQLQALGYTVTLERAA
jgi:transposase